MPEDRRFTALFGRPHEVAADAPGRVNLIGDHTDYNGGFVLPTALPQRTRVELARRADRRVRAASVQWTGVPEFTLGEEVKHGRWIDYVQGITAVLGAAGHAIDGFDLRIDSDVPPGAGLSSSAALEVALLRGLRRLFSLEFDDDRLIALAHRAETEFVGVPVGLMDQIACCRGDTSSALFVDTRSLAIERVPLPPALGLVVIHSGVSHSLSDGSYAARRAECAHAAHLLGVPQLRDVAPDDPRIAVLPDTLARRVRHVVTEDQRVLTAVRALREGELWTLGALFNASHRSLRDDYEVSIPEIDTLVDLARHHPAVFGARLTGGGFGGSVVILAEHDRTARVAAAVTSAYRDRVGRHPLVVIPWLHQSDTCPTNPQS